MNNDSSLYIRLNNFIIYTYTLTWKIIKICTSGFCYNKKIKNAVYCKIYPHNTS